MPAIVAAILFFALALIRAVGSDEPRDFFIYRLGAELAARGENPYDIPKIRKHVAERFPGEEAKGFAENCGYFLPPMAVLIYMPFAMLPWVAAKVAWAVANGLAAYFIARLALLLLRPRDAPPPPLLLYAVIPFLLLLNPLTPVIVFPVGQTSVLFVGCVAAGLLAFERGRPYLGAMLWVLPFVKPHLALALIPLAWFLGGWRPAAVLVALVGLLNLIGATVVGGSPLFLVEYLDYLPQARDAVKFNRVELNPALSSWNCLLFWAGGPLVELTAATTFAGYLVWFGLFAARCAATNATPSAAWVAAMTAAGAVLCSQVLVYELLFLAVAMPWVRDLFSEGHPIRGGMAVALLSLPLLTMAAPRVKEAMESFGVPAYHSLAMALFALLVLAGPTKNEPVTAA